MIDQGFPIIVECDENQHFNYSCENKRICELFLDLGSRPLRVLRFNPDSYRDINGKKIASCFEGTTTIKREWQRRTTKFIEIISQMLEQDKADFPKKEIQVLNFFYDGFE